MVFSSEEPETDISWSIRVVGSLPRNPSGSRVLRNSEPERVPGSQELGNPHETQGSGFQGTREPAEFPSSLEPGTHINFVQKESERLYEYSIVFNNA